MTAEKIILKYQEKGVKLFLNEDKLQFSGPKGIIDDDARKELQAYTKIMKWAQQILFHRLL